ncbi:MAG TPA: hypothetical protein ENI11_06465 [Actinobacteria bacterium]|nr:hypothetical protein [Actinomycetota bacterium]
MIISDSQIVGLVMAAAVIIFILVFMKMMNSRIDAIFRPAIRTAGVWGIVILLIQTIFLIAGSKTG